MQLDFCIINDGSRKNNNILPDTQKKRGTDAETASAGNTFEAISL